MVDCCFTMIVTLAALWFDPLTFPGLHHLTWRLWKLAAPMWCQEMEGAWAASSHGLWEWASNASFTPQMEVPKMGVPHNGWLKKWKILLKYDVLGKPPNRTAASSIEWYLIYLPMGTTIHPRCPTRITTPAVHRAPQGLLPTPQKEGKRAKYG